MDSIGEELRKRRKAKELTISRLSQMSEVSASHIGRVEQGERSPGSLILSKLEKVLGVVEKSETLEETYGLEKHEVQLKRVETKSRKWLELFPNPKKPYDEFRIEGRNYRVEIVFPEFTCRCPRTSQPDFATITIEYVPNKWCVELKALKYYFNSFRDEGHFHEAVTNMIYDDLEKVLEPINLYVEGRFNVRGGTWPVVRVGHKFKDEL